MPRRTPGRVAVAAALVLLTALPAVPALGGTRDRLVETRRKLRATRAKIASLKRTDAELLAAIAEVGAQLARTRNHLDQAKARYSTLQFKISNTERKIARLERSRRLRAAKLATRARELYILGPGARFEALMGSNSFDEFIARTSTIEFAIRFDRTVIEDLGRIQHKQRLAKRELAAEQAEAHEARRQVYQRAQIVYEALATRRAAERALAGRIREFQEEARQLEREQARILELIRRRTSFSVGPVSRSGFQWPIRGRITSRYGPRWGSYHTGIDIDCETGDRIAASKGGRVIASEWGGGYGRMVIIDHGNGVTTLYAHMSRLSVGEGASVTRGQTVGRCGSTGNSTGSHLHFEVRVNGRHQNPMHFLP